MAEELTAKDKSLKEISIMIVIVICVERLWWLFILFPFFVDYVVCDVLIFTLDN